MGGAVAFGTSGASAVLQRLWGSQLPSWAARRACGAWDARAASPRTAVAWDETGSVGAARSALPLPALRGHYDGAAARSGCATVLLGGCDRAGVAAARRQGPVGAASPQCRMRLARELRVAGAVEHGEQVAAGGLRKAPLPASTALAARIWTSSKGRAGGNDAVVLRAYGAWPLRPRRASVRGSGAGCMTMRCGRRRQKPTPPYWATEIRVAHGQPLSRGPPQPVPRRKAHDGIDRPKTQRSR
jgi:hypothetical protein